jgi:multicomponent Na+:H+ antiporter subunit B
MNRRARLLVFLVGAVLLAVVLGFALAGLPGYGAPLGHYAQIVANTSVAERHATNSVIAVTFDYRALDTLGEEFMIFVAAIGASVLLRSARDERADERIAKLDEERAPQTSDVLRALGIALVPVTVVLGVYVVSHGQLTPGGGFQGGVVVATAFLFVYVAGQQLVTRRVGPAPSLEVAEALGAAAFALVGVGGLIFAGAYLENFLSYGTKGDLLSGGTLPLSNLAVGVEVTGAFALVLGELLDQVVFRLGSKR